MTIGTAARLQTSQTLHAADLAPAEGDQAYSRCYWSIYVLEKTFSPSFVLTSQYPYPPAYPPSPSPPAVASSSDALAQSMTGGDQDPLDKTSRSAGINACCLEAVGVWGDILAYLESVRAGHAEQSWNPASMCSQLMKKLYDLEVKIEEQHLLRKVAFQDRSPNDLKTEREYWAPWIVMQFISHSGYAALHNPFIQFVALRKQGSLPAPLTILQRSVDQSLFHSAWVARLLRTCRALSFDIFDPLVAQIVAATATIPWLFQFAKDEAIATKAKDEIREFELALLCFAKKWPYIARKVSCCLLLPATYCTNRPEGSHSPVSSVL